MSISFGLVFLLKISNEDIHVFQLFKQLFILFLEFLNLFTLVSISA